MQIGSVGYIVFGLKSLKEEEPIATNEKHKAERIEIITTRLLGALCDSFGSFMV
jgi:hypothetical protein